MAPVLAICLSTPIDIVEIYERHGGADHGCVETVSFTEVSTKRNLQIIYF